MVTYTSKELNEMIGYCDKSGSNSSKQAILTRCKNAGLIVEALDTPRGKPNQYIIIENNFLLPDERWIVCYCNDEWEVSNMGRIRRISTKKLMGYTSEDGYSRICMIDKQTQKSTNKQLNRLVFFSFFPEYLANESQIQIDHIDGDRDNNKLSNLRPMTNVENIQARDTNQTKLKTITTQLVNKFGYEKTQKLLENLLTNE